MAERNLDGFLVLGEGHGAVMRYLTNGGYFEGALLLKARGEEVTLVHGMMERDTAAATGLRTVNREEHFNGYQLLKEFEGDRLAASAAYIARAMEMIGLRGRVGVYGLQDAGASLALMGKVKEQVEGIEMVGEYGETLFSQAFVTKDDAELEILKRAGRLTCAVVGETQAFIQGHRVGRDGTVLKAEGGALTIGDVKAYMRGRLHAKGAAGGPRHDFFAGAGCRRTAQQRRSVDAAATGPHHYLRHLPEDGGGLLPRHDPHVVSGLRPRRRRRRHMTRQRRSSTG